MMLKVKNKISLAIVCVVLLLAGCAKNEESITTADRDKLIGTWDGQSHGANGPRNFNLVILASNSAPDQIKMENFDGGSGIVFATVNGNSISIASQIVSNETIQGTGSFNGSTITFTFSVDDGQQVENRTATASNKH